jgi:hypothetical protein
LLLPFIVLPAYAAVIVCVTALGDDVVKVASAGIPVSVSDPIFTPSSRKLTGPVGTEMETFPPPLTVTDYLNLTAVPYVEGL